MLNLVKDISKKRNLYIIMVTDDLSDCEKITNIDKNRTNGNFLLTGSSNVLDHKESKDMIKSA